MATTPAPCGAAGQTCCGFASECACDEALNPYRFVCLDSPPPDFVQGAQPAHLHDLSAITQSALRLVVSAMISRTEVDLCVFDTCLRSTTLRTTSVRPGPCTATQFGRIEH